MIIFNFCYFMSFKFSTNTSTDYNYDVDSFIVSSYTSERKLLCFNQLINNCCPYAFRWFVFNIFWHVQNNWYLLKLKQSQVLSLQAQKKSFQFLSIRLRSIADEISKNKLQRRTRARVCKQFHLVSRTQSKRYYSTRRLN